MVEFFREPDPNLVFMEYFTMGHLLCLPMIVAGIILFIFSIKIHQVSMTETLQNLLISRIQKTGPISLTEFMAEALP